MIEVNCSIEDLVGNISFAGIALDSGDTMLSDESGGCAEVAIDQIWRDEQLLARINSYSAFRLGAFWQEWFTKSHFTLIATESGK